MLFKRNKKPGKESSEALFLAQRHLEEVKARNKEVESVVASSIAIRRQNHFAEQLTALMRGGVTT